MCGKHPERSHDVLSGVRAVAACDITHSCVDIPGAQFKGFYDGCTTDQSSSCIKR